MGNSGGFALLWRKDIKVDIHSYFSNHIEAVVELSSNSHSFRLKGIYGFLLASQRSGTWRFLRNLHSGLSLRWFIGGDNIEILRILDNRSYPPCPSYLMDAFNSVLMDCHLFDLAYSGFSFTWSNNCAAPEMIRFQLDRVCANVDGQNLFPAHWLYMEISGPDHIPLLLQLQDMDADSGFRHTWIFLFESMWIRKRECEEIVREVWSNSLLRDPIEPVLRNAQLCGAKLVSWASKRENNPHLQIKEHQKRLVHIKSGPQTQNARLEAMALTGKLEFHYADQVAYWKRRGKAEWMKSGDWNMKFLHAKDTAHHKTNRVKGLMD